MNVKTSEQLLEQLADTLEARKSADPAKSYTASLYQQGLDVILKKLGEEAIEVIIAAKTDRNQLIQEMADLWFHSLVLLCQQGLRPEQVLNVLHQRLGTSGIAEKQARQFKQ